MNPESPYKISQDLELVSPRKVKGYPISIVEWNLIKEKIGHIKDTANIYFIIGGALIGVCLTAMLTALTNSFPRTTNGSMPTSQIICWAVAVISFIAAALFFNSGRERRKVQKNRANDVIQLMEMIEARFKEEDIHEDISEKSTLFLDNFETFEGWTDWEGGTLEISSDFAHSGNFCLKKDKNGDPAGGFKSIRSQIELGVVFSGWIYRPSNLPGGKADRLAIEDDNHNGYGFSVNHTNNVVQIERRDRGENKFISSEFHGKLKIPKDDWYRFMFYMRKEGIFELYLYDKEGPLIAEALSREDHSYSVFSIVAIHGGYPYYIDDLRVETL